MAKVSTPSETEAITTDNGSMELGKVKESNLSASILITQAAGRITKSKDAGSNFKHPETYTKVIFRTIWSMGREKFCLLMATAIRATSSRTFSQDTASTLLRMETVTKGTGPEEIVKVKENLSQQTVSLMMENGKMTKKMGRELKPTKMELNMLDSSNKTRKMAKECKLTKEGSDLKEPGWII